MSDASNLFVDWRARRAPSPKQKLFTPAVLAWIPRWLAEGLSSAEIAARIGCTIGSLRVRCSHNRISLRRPRAARPTRIAPSGAPGMPRLSVALPDSILSIIEARASQRGETGRTLAAALLAKIAEDDLFAAVLDEEAA
jgi:hypothetical protein